MDYRSLLRRAWGCREELRLNRRLAPQVYRDVMPLSRLLAGFFRPCVIDCLEFNADLRRLDPAEEIAFLALECARLGNPALGGGFMQRYQSLAQDPVPDGVWQFYRSPCAATRAPTPTSRMPPHARAALLTTPVAQASGAAVARAGVLRSAAAQAHQRAARDDAGCASLFDECEFDLASEACLEQFAKQLRSLDATHVRRHNGKR